ncbi:MAG: hypothetical protein WCH43_11195 [Verrucomicrobiota bacterium]
MNTTTEFQARIAAAKEAGNLFIVPSGVMHYEERQRTERGRYFFLLVERRHNGRDITHAKRILRRAKDAIGIQILHAPA